MNFQPAMIGLALLPVSMWAQPICEAGTPNAMLQWASPKNWVLLSLGGPTSVTITDSLTVYPMTNRALGISATGDLTVNGASIVRSRVLLNSSGNLTQYGPSYVSPIEQDENADAYLTLARVSAFWGAQCAATLPSTVYAPDVNITDPSGNMTISSDQQINIVNLGDLIITNGVLTLSSHFPNLDSPPTFIVNISGTFRLEGGSKIILDGTLNELHVLFNVIGPGQDVALAGSIGSDGLPTTQISGVLLVPMRNINLSSGLVNGAVIGGGSSIAITGGSQIVSHLQ